MLLVCFPGASNSAHGIRFSGYAGVTCAGIAFPAAGNGINRAFPAGLLLRFRLVMLEELAAEGFKGGAFLNGGFGLRLVARACQLVNFQAACALRCYGSLPGIAASTAGNGDGARVDACLNGGL